MNRPDLSSNPLSEYIQKLMSDGIKLSSFRATAKPPKDGSSEPVPEDQYKTRMNEYIAKNLQPPVMDTRRQTNIIEESYKCYLQDIWNQSNDGKTKVIDIMLGGSPSTDDDNLVATLVDMNASFGEDTLRTKPPELQGGDLPVIIQKILTDEQVFNDFRTNCSNPMNTPENPQPLKKYLETINIGDKEEPLYLTDSEATSLAYGFIMAYQQKSYQSINQCLGNSLYASLW